MGVLRLVIGRSGELVPLDYVSGRERAAGAVPSRLLPVCCPVREPGTAPARRMRPARPVTRALWGWR
jgi:hypothetical protein